MNAETPPPLSPLFGLYATVETDPASASEFAAWHSEIMDHFAKFHGTVSMEFKAMPGVSGRWSMCLRFESEEALKAWRRSGVWSELQEELRPLLRRGASVEFSVAREELAHTGVSEVIVTKVLAGKSRAYRDWATRIRSEQIRHPGFIGSYVQPPPPGAEHWTTVIRFDTPANLERWMKSPERLALLRELPELVEYNLAHGIRGSFPGWVPADPRTGEAPPNWKTALLVLLGLFPAVSLTALFVHPRLEPLTFEAATFFGNCITVAFTTWIGMPVLIRAFGWFLYPQRNLRRVNALGLSVIFGLLAAEVLAVGWLAARV